MGRRRILTVRIAASVMVAPLVAMGGMRSWAIQRWRSFTPEALFAPAVDRLVAAVPNASDLKRSILSHHTTVEDAGRVAEAAGVGTLVLSHWYRQTIRRSRTRCGSMPRAATFADA